MCFSAPASFVASGGLALLGGASLKSAKKENIFLAFIPLIFAVQQAIEGFQWIFLNEGPPSLPLAYGFLFFAFIVWPIYVPACVYFLDKEHRKKLKWFLFMGILLSLFYLFILLTEPLTVRLVEHSISYDFHIPFADFSKLFYLAVVSIPLIISSVVFLRWLAMVLVLSAIISHIFYFGASISVWCFFAAVISSMIFLYLKSKKISAIWNTI